MAVVVYVLCAATSLGCTAMLLRGYLRSGVRLLLWSGLCFVGLFLSNLFVVLDLVVFPDVYLAPVRSFTAVAGLLVLIYGLVFESA